MSNTDTPTVAIPAVAPQLVTFPAITAVASPAPAEVDGVGGPKKHRPRKASTKAPGTKVPRAAQVAAGVTSPREAGTKLQTQVPRAWRDEIMKLAKRQGIRESDVIRDFIRRGLGIGKLKARAQGVQA